MTESASPAADPMGRRLRKAFLRTADVIERNPDRFEFGSYAVPSRHDCGTPACALGWICAFMGRRVARKSDNGDPGDVFCVTRGVAPLGITEGQFYRRMDEVAGTIDWHDTGADCARALRLYADKWYPT
jgi:hypothetical protein